MRILIIILAIALIVGGIAAAFLWDWDNAEFDGDSEFEMSGVVEYQGVNYKLRNDVETILLMGMDKFEEEIDLTSYTNDQCADFLVLLVIDHAAKTCSTIQINRDTMTMMNVLGINGNKVDTAYGQVALSHTYGSGSNDSCRNTARAVANIFGGMKVDYYVALTMDAVPVINDLVGGITLEVLDDLTSVNPEFVEGATVTLMGDDALRYVRARKGVGDQTNISRMKRQNQYMNLLYDKIIELMGEDENDVHITSDLVPYLTSNCSINELESLLESLKTYDNGGTYEIEGEDRKSVV